MGVRMYGTVMDSFSPFTTCPVARVELSSESRNLGIPSEVVLKTFDRRFLRGVRDIWEEGRDWSTQKEGAYRRYVDDVTRGLLPAFDRHAFEKEVRDQGDDEELPQGKFEAYTRLLAESQYEVEREAYERFSSLQGKEVPKLFAVAKVAIGISDGNSTSPDTFPAILLEDVRPSLTLRQLIETWTARRPLLPNEVLFGVCEKAIEAVDVCSDFDLVNDDIRMDNILVREPFLTQPFAPSSSSAAFSLIEHPVVIIDFGEVIFRKNETEEEWKISKCYYDEMGAVGFVAANLIEKHVGKGLWQYRRNLRWYN